MTEKRSSSPGDTSLSDATDNYVCWCLHNDLELYANVREFFFACRVVNVWNSLPDTVCFTSLAVFKKCIRTVDFSKFLMCNDV